MATEPKPLALLKHRFGCHIDHRTFDDTCVAEAYCFGYRTNRREQQVCQLQTYHYLTNSQFHRQSLFSGLSVRFTRPSFSQFSYGCCKLLSLVSLLLLAFTYHQWGSQLIKYYE